MTLGGVTEGFEQKSLRQWKRRHPGHRSFTVLRHPLLRAHAAFRRKIVLGRAQDLRRILINGFLAELQPPGEPFRDCGSRTRRLPHLPELLPPRRGWPDRRARRSQPRQPDRARPGLRRVPAARPPVA
jgi:hypothetical protein